MAAARQIPSVVLGRQKEAVRGASALHDFCRIYSGGHARAADAWRLAERAQCLAQSGRGDRTPRCPLSGVKRTFLERTSMSAIDPSGHDFSLIQINVLSTR